MKKITLTLFALMLICQFAFSQYSDKGFSFQGYAIDGNSKALASKGITVRFTIYRTGTSYIEEQAVTTDAFGVFSAIIGTEVPTSTTTFEELNFNNFDFSLKVDVKETLGGTYVTISDKALSAVPYARSASNGVPVGTVVAYAGPDTNIPTGWLLCNGATLNANTNIQYSQLFDAIGTVWGGSDKGSFKVPDFRGQFLRGLNTSTSGTDPNRTMGIRQDDTFKSHNHTATQPAHNHSTSDSFWNESSAGVTAAPGYTVNFETNPTDTDLVGGGQGATSGDYDNVLWTRPVTSSSSQPAITVGSTGDGETRPDNHAVNYIIKY